MTRMKVLCGLRRASNSLVLLLHDAVIARGVIGCKINCKHVTFVNCVSTECRLVLRKCSSYSCVVQLVQRNFATVFYLAGVF